MHALDAAAVAAAALRLRGHVVATPLLGTPFGLPADLDLRSKPELLQPGASGWFRGYLHYLLRRLGSPAGIVAAVPPERAAAAAIAAALHRLPLVYVAAVPPDDALATTLAAAGAEVQLASDPGASAAALRQRKGFALLPDARDPDVALGLATIGLELAGQLPHATVAVYAPAEIAPALASGLLAGGRAVPVRAATAMPSPEVAALWLRLHGLRLGQDGQQAFAAALATGGPQPAAAVLMD